MSDDPAGYYALLEVDPGADPVAITAAYRRKARVLHPDVAGSGDVNAFVRLKAAYDVVGDASRRAAYDRAARAAAAAPPRAAAMPAPPIRGPRLSDLPLPAWLGLGGLFCLAAVMAVLQFNRAPAPVPSQPAIRPFAPAASVAKPTMPIQPVQPATDRSTHYIAPAGGDTIIWQVDTMGVGYRPAGQVASFTPVRVLRLVPERGLVEIALVDGGSAFVDAARLAPGDRMAARRSFCAYNAGPPPANGEVLARQGTGGAQIEVTNRAGQPAVVKLRDAAGRSAATVFVAPGDRTVIAGLPDIAYRPDFAIGELWSRACNDFAAGTRAQRFAGYLSAPSLSPLVVPPDAPDTMPPEDITDAAFEQD